MMLQAAKAVADEKHLGSRCGRNKRSAQRLRLSSSYGGKAFSLEEMQEYIGNFQTKLKPASYEGIEGTRSRVRTWSAAVPSGA
ncbi:hypothetical protein P7H22_18140 [Paenibacillus larvae]|nr:hypothetical protein [Paenibacillus larvae]MDT2241865.1 hypothetical protein [Paenibacillus larvae]